MLYFDLSEPYIQRSSTARDVFDEPLTSLGFLSVSISFLMKMVGKTIRYGVRVHKSFLNH